MPAIPPYSPQRDENNPDFWVQVTAFDGVQYYAWTTVNWTTDADGGVPDAVDQDSPLQGTLTPLSSPLFEANGNAIPIGSFVKIRRAYRDAVMDWLYVAVFCCSPVQCIDVVTDWQCIDGVVYLTKKRICGQFTVTDP